MKKLKYVQSVSGIVNYRKQDLPADTVKCIDEKGYAPHPHSTHVFHNTFLHMNPSLVGLAQNLTSVWLRPDSPPSVQWIDCDNLDGTWACSGLCLADMGFGFGTSSDVFVSECVLFLAQAPTLVFLTEHIKTNLLYALSADGSIAKLETVSVNVGRGRHHPELACLAPMRQSMSMVSFLKEMVEDGECEALGQTRPDPARTTRAAADCYPRIPV